MTKGTQHDYGATMSTTELAKGIYWVGAVDWDVRDFHGYSTYRGTTYNSFLIVDEKVTLFDTVKESHTEEMLRNIREIIDPAKIDYLVVNHVEMDLFTDGAKGDHRPLPP
jgi:flavorubredoxin